VVLMGCVGCGGAPGIPVTGKLLRDGKPYQPPLTERLSVTFYLLERPGESDRARKQAEPYFAQLKPEDSTFSVPGPAGSGIPAGKYRITVEQKRKREALADAKHGAREAVDRDADSFQGFYDFNRSTLNREITKPTDVEIDLAMFFEEQAKPPSKRKQIGEGSD
jgi:hypothetical protein